MANDNSHRQKVTQLTMNWRVYLNRIKNKQTILPLLLVLAVVLIMRKLFTGFIGYGDGPIYWPDGIFSHFYAWEQSNLGFNNSGSLSSAPILSIFYKILFWINIKPTQIYNFLPLIILCLSIFFITKKISNNNAYALFAGLFVILNNFILEQLVFWPGPYFINVLSLVLLFYSTYIIYIKKELNIKRCVILILVSLLALHPFFLILYLSYLFLFFVYYSLDGLNLKFLTRIFLVFSGILLIHSFWLIPFLHNMLNQSVNDFYNGNLQGLFSGYLSVASYTNLFNYANYPGLLSFKEHQSASQYLFYFLLLAILFASLFFVNKRINFREKKYLVFLTAIFLVYFNISLGPNSIPTGKIWLWSFDNFPGFEFFRSFTRPLIICLISEIFILALLVKNHPVADKIKKYIAVSIIIFLISTNLIFFTGNLNGTIGSFDIPKEYFEINEKYFKNDEKSFSIISYPNLPYESYVWSINKNVDDFPQISYFNLCFFSKPIIYNGFSFFLDKKNVLFSKLFAFENIFNFEDNFDRDLGNLNVRYIMVRKDFFDVLNPGRKVEYGKYYEYFSNNPLYYLREDNNYFVLFEKKDFHPLIFSGNTRFKKENQTEYKLNVNNLRGNQSLSFLESFHDGWQLYIRPISDHFSCDKIGEYGDRIIECNPENKLLEKGDLSYFWEKPIFDNTHRTVFQYANGWIIDSDFIKQSFPEEYYKENSDGSIDINLVLYFKPQTYFYLGFLISGTALLSCLFYLGYVWYKSKKKKKKIVSLAVFDQDEIFESASRRIRSMDAITRDNKEAHRKKGDG